jgi:Leucine-rich repeat (LRR) protein
MYLMVSEITDIGYTNILPPLPKLRELYLNGNPIEKISPDAFDNTTGLKVLLLHHTKLTEIPDGVFSKLTKLHTLWINNANIKDIGVNAFKNLTSLKSLWLNGNNISKFNEGQFYGLSSINELDITKNIDLSPSCCELCGVNPVAVKMNSKSKAGMNEETDKDGNKIWKFTCGNKIIIIYIYYYILINTYNSNMTGTFIL